MNDQNDQINIYSEIMEAYRMELSIEQNIRDITYIIHALRLLRSRLRFLILLNSLYIHILRQIMNENYSTEASSNENDEE